MSRRGVPVRGACRSGDVLAHGVGATPETYWRMERLQHRRHVGTWSTCSTGDVIPYGTHEAPGA